MTGKGKVKMVIHRRIQLGQIPIGKTEAMKDEIADCLGLHLLMGISHQDKINYHRNELKKLGG